MNDKLRESKAPKDGATESSLAGASMADLKDGYCKIECEKGEEFSMGDNAFSGGFLGRSPGFDR